MGEVYRIGTEFYPYHMARRVWERNIEPYATEDTITIVESFRELVNYDYFHMLLEKNKISGITTIRVIRPNFNAIKNKEFEHHVSESDLDDFQFDFIIKNDGNYEDLVNEIKNKLGEYLEGGM